MYAILNLHCGNLEIPLASKTDTSWPPKSECKYPITKIQSCDDNLEENIVGLFKMDSCRLIQEFFFYVLPPSEDSKIPLVMNEIPIAAL